MGIKPKTQPGADKDQRTGTCKICIRGIFAGQERVWSQKPLGFVHADCVPATVSRG